MLKRYFLPGLLLAVAANPLILSAQEPPEAARLRALNGQIVSLLAQYQGATPAEQANLSVRAGEVLAQREAALQSVIDQDPDQALRLAFPPGLLKDLADAFPQSAARLEARGTWQGTLEYYVEDGVNLATWRDVLRMSVNGKTVNIRHRGVIPEALKCNDRVAAAGVLAGNKLASESLILAEPAAVTCSTTGAQNIAVIVVSFPSKVVDPAFTTAHVKGVFLGNAASGQNVSPDWSISDFWYQNSDFRTWVNNSGVGALAVVHVTLAQDYAYCICDANGCSNNSTAVRQAAYAAADPFLNYNDFSRIVIILPNNGSCSGIAGVGTLGCWGGECPGDGKCGVSWTWWRDDQSKTRSTGVRLGTHEMGHNHTLGHSGSRDHGTQVIAAPGVAGSRSEYGDVFGTMGSWNFGFYNAHHAVSLLGWMNSSNYLDVTGPGTYTINSFEKTGNVVKALRIKRGSTVSNAWFWLQYFPKNGIYLSQLGGNVWNGATIHAQDAATPGGKTDLLDFTPTSTGNHGDPALEVGQCWQDAYTDVGICVLSKTTDTLTVSVSYTPPPCTEANPTVVISPDSASTPAGTPYSFSVRVDNNDSSSCPARTFNLDSSLPDGPDWSTLFSPASLSISPQGFATATMTKTPTEATLLNTYPVNATATSGASSGSDTASITVTAVAPPAAPSNFVAKVNVTGAGKNKTFQNITLTWTDNSSNETGFVIERCQVTGKGKTTSCTYSAYKTAGANVTSLVDTVKPAAGNYKFQIRAVKDALASAWVESNQVTVP